MECPAAKILFENYSKVATQYFEAVDKVSAVVGLHDQFAAAERLVEQTQEKCRRARSILEKHWLEHGCRADPRRLPDFVPVLRKLDFR
jgi:hypothetical protein